MRMRPTHPIPILDPTVPAVQQALLRIKLELALVRLEHPEMTPRQQLAEARRRCAEVMVAAADVLEARRYDLSIT